MKVPTTRRTQPSLALSCRSETTHTRPPIQNIPVMPIRKYWTITLNPRLTPTPYSNCDLNQKQVYDRYGIPSVAGLFVACSDSIRLGLNGSHKKSGVAQDLHRAPRIQRDDAVDRVSQSIHILQDVLRKRSVRRDYWCR